MASLYPLQEPRFAAVSQKEGHYASKEALELKIVDNGTLIRKAGNVYFRSRAISVLRGLKYDSAHIASPVQKADDRVSRSVTRK